MKILEEIQSFKPDEFYFDEKNKAKELMSQLINIIETQVELNEKMIILMIVFFVREKF